MLNQKRIIEREEQFNYSDFSLEDLNEFTNEVKKRVPIEFHNSIRFEVKLYSEMYDNRDYAGIFITFKDYETEEEKNSRLALENKIALDREAYERKLFEELSKKFSK